MKAKIDHLKSLSAKYTWFFIIIIIRWQHFLNFNKFLYFIYLLPFDLWHAAQMQEDKSPSMWHHVLPPHPSGQQDFILTWLFDSLSVY